MDERTETPTHVPTDERTDAGHPPQRVAHSLTNARTIVARGGERALAAAAHGAIAFGFVGIGFLLSLAITAVIWVASWRSRYVREQSDRAGRYQIVVLLVNVLTVALWVAGLALLLWLTGWRLFGWGGGDPGVAGAWWVGLIIFALLILLIAAVPVFAVWYVGTIVYGVYGAARALAGHDFRYLPLAWPQRRGGEQAQRRGDGGRTGAGMGVRADGPANTPMDERTDAPTHDEEAR